MLTASFSGFVSYFSRRYWLWYVFGILALWSTTFISLWLPQLSKDVINGIELAGSGHGQLSNELMQIPILIVALGLTLTVVRSLSRILIFWPGQKIAADTRSWVSRQFIRYRQSQLISAGIGDLVSRMSNDVTHLRLLCGFGLLQIANLGFLLGMALWFMIRTDVLLTFLALAPISGLLVVTYFGMPYIQKFSREQQDVMGALTNRVTESFSNVQTVQLHVAYKAFEHRIEVENQKILSASIKLMIVRTLTFPFMILFSGLAEALVIIVGGMKVIDGLMTVGDILAFNIYVGLLGFPLAAVGIIVSLVQRASTALARLREVENAPKEDFDVDQEAPSQARGIVVGEKRDVPVLEFRSVVFSYPGRSERALNNVSFSLHERERLGLCGPVGAGKTTLFALATRLYDPEPGQIFFRGRDVLEMDLLELRARIRHLTQTVQLFSDTIAENLHFGLSVVPNRETLVEACRRAQVLEDIQALPNGFETQIGEKGVRLSGGQRQRLALARMMLRDGDVYLFDDVVSAVDTRTESALLDQFFRLEAAFCITSHRDSTLRRCDRVLFMRDGRLEYMGAFEGFEAQRQFLKEDFAGDSASFANPSVDDSLKLESDPFPRGGKA